MNIVQKAEALHEGAQAQANGKAHAEFYADCYRGLLEFIQEHQHCLRIPPDAAEAKAAQEDSSDGFREASGQE